MDRARAAVPGGSFGAGGADPYERALRSGDARLTMRGAGAGRDSVHVGRFVADADEVERRLLDRVRGPLLDVGAGPGRMVAAALACGIPALGVDVSAGAVAIGRAAGLPMLRRSVFAPMHGEGGWATVLLLDGNIGIGGAAAALLARCRELMAPDGRVLVEVDADESHLHVFTAVLRDEVGRASAPFPWAQLGRAALVAAAADARLEPESAWTDAGRSFVLLRR